MQKKKSTSSSHRFENKAWQGESTGSGTATVGSEYYQGQNSPNAFTAGAAAFNPLSGWNAAQPYSAGGLQQKTNFNLCFDIFEDGDNLVVQVPFPGLIENTLEVVQNNRVLKIRGKTQVGDAITETEYRNYFVSQIPKGWFEQTILLPIDIDNGSSKANYESGILTIQLVKAQWTLGNKVSVAFKS